MAIGPVVRQKHGAEEAVHLMVGGKQKGNAADIRDALQRHLSRDLLLPTRHNKYNVYHFQTVHSTMDP